MQKCFYHPKTDASTMCMGCKMPICQTCQSEGKKGFCESCMKKVASLSDRITDMKKTGMVNNQKATMIKTSSRPTALKNVTYCFHHFDIVASGTCPTCNRPFCPACLNSAGVCSHCATHSEEAQERLYKPTERGRALESGGPQRPARKAPPRAASGPNRTLLIAAAVGLVLVAAFFMAGRKPAPAPQAPDGVLNKTELSAEQEAMLAQLEAGQKNAVSLDDAGRPRGGSGAGAKESVLGHAPAARAGAPVSVAVAAPRSGQTISGLSVISARVGGQPDRVECFVDGESIRTLSAPPYDFDFATHSVANGQHRITLIAYGGGRKSVSNVAVNVRN